MRVSPPGRVVGPRPGDQGAHVTPDGHTFTMSGPTSDAGAAVSSHAGWSRRRHREFDPDDPWAVDEGVPPVLAPGPEPYHDPGPGVIGIDR